MVCYAGSNELFPKWRTHFIRGPLVICSPSVGPSRHKVYFSPLQSAPTTIIVNVGLLLNCSRGPDWRLPGFPEGFPEGFPSDGYRCRGVPTTFHEGSSFVPLTSTIFFASWSGWGGAFHFQSRRLSHYLSTCPVPRCSKPTPQSTYDHQHVQVPILLPSRHNQAPADLKSQSWRPINFKSQCPPSLYFRFHHLRLQNHWRRMRQRDLIFLFQLCLRRPGQAFCCSFAGCHSSIFKVCFSGFCLTFSFRFPSLQSLFLQSVFQIPGVQSQPSLLSLQSSQRLQCHPSLPSPSLQSLLVPSHSLASPSLHSLLVPSLSPQSLQSQLSPPSLQSQQSLVVPGPFVGSFTAGPQMCSKSMVSAGHTAGPQISITFSSSPLPAPHNSSHGFSGCMSFCVFLRDSSTLCVLYLLFFIPCLPGPPQWALVWVFFVSAPGGTSLIGSGVGGVGDSCPYRCPSLSP